MSAPARDLELLADLASEHLKGVVRRFAEDVRASHQKGMTLENARKLLGKIDVALRAEVDILKVMHLSPEYDQVRRL